MTGMKRISLPGFVTLSQMNDSSCRTYTLEGMEQKHFYFQLQNLAIWLAADPDVADNALQQTLEAYP